MSPPPFASIWIVGASSGIGRDAALAFARAGVKVVASARSADKLDLLAAEAPPGMVLPLALDITDRDASLAAIGEAEQKLGRPVNALLACAATWSNTREDQANLPAVRASYEVNVFGTLNVIEAALGVMRPRRAGRIAIISSVAGFRGLPRALAYGSTKAALTHIAEALKFQCDPDGIVVQVIHPGFVRTPLTDKNDFPMPFLMEADAAAQRIVKGMSNNGFEITFPRRFTYLLKLLRLLPYGLYFWLVGKAVGGR